MSVNATGPVNPAQILAHLGHGDLKAVGDPAQPGAELSSTVFSDDDIQQAVSAVTYDPNYGQDAKTQAVNTIKAVAAGTQTATVAQLAQDLVTAMGW